MSALFPVPSLSVSSCSFGSFGKASSPFSTPSPSISGSRQSGMLSSSKSAGLTFASNGSPPGQAFSLASDMPSLSSSGSALSQNGAPNSSTSPSLLRCSDESSGHASTTLSKPSPSTSSSKQSGMLSLSRSPGIDNASNGSVLQVISSSSDTPSLSSSGSALSQSGSPNGSKSPSKLRCSSGSSGQASAVLSKPSPSISSSTQSGMLSLSKSSAFNESSMVGST